MIKKILFIGFILYMLGVRAEEISVHNKSELPLFAAIYNKRYAKEATRYTTVKEINPNETVTFEIPQFQTLVFREMAFSFNSNDLKETLTEDQFLLLGVKNIGVGQGYNFYILINPNHGSLHAYNTVEWHVIKPIQDKFNQAISFLSTNTLGQLRRSLIKDFPYTHNQAVVRTDNSICEQEQKFIEARMPKVKQAIESFIGDKISYTPKIAFCGSGGGYRAMLGSLGNLQGAEEIGLLNTALYMAGLSGSTWAIATWLESGLDPSKMNQYLKPKLAASLTKNFTYSSSFVKELLLKYSFNQPLSLVDPYGALLASSLLITNRANPYIIHLSDQADIIKTGSQMMPIYTAIVTKTPYEWVEFTPFEIGSDYLKGYIPTWSFGRKFAFGRSIDNAPEQPLGYLMGIWGSAFTANFKEMILNLGANLKPTFLKNALEKTFEETIIGRQRIYPAQVFNFMLGVPKTPRYQQTTLSLIDAGLEFNLPIPPLMRKDRAVDIIIVFDASDTSIRGGELKKAEAYFAKQGLPFPKIELEAESNEVCYVFKDAQNPSIPVVIYFPLTKNEKYNAQFDPLSCIPNFCSSFNFTYKPEEVDLLTGLTKFNMIQSKDIIKQVIQEVIGQKSSIAG